MDRKAYRNSRTNGIRWSSNPLGFPWVAATDAEADGTPAAKAKAKAKRAPKAKAGTEGAPDA